MNLQELEEYLKSEYEKIVAKSLNGKDAKNELNHKIFVEHIDEFNRLTEEAQWVIRNFIDALNKVYGL